MKHLSTTVFLLLCIQLMAQPETEVYLLDVSLNDGKAVLTNARNISNNKGYDNQPSFYDKNTLLFASTRNGQTDIAKFNIPDGSISWISNTPGGSEYSPLKIPGKNEISSIRLDTSGLQRLYRYGFSRGQSKELIKDLKIGYHLWYNEDIIVSTVLVEDRMDLVVSNLQDGSNRTVQKNVGRSLHKIPDSELISYMSNEGETWEIKSMNPVSGVTENIVQMISGVQDMCWLEDGTILAPKDKSIVRFNPKTDKQWSLFHRFEEKEINNITRLALSPAGGHIAIVSGESPDVVVQKQVDSFNKGDLEAFVSCYSENVLVQNFPKDTSYIGTKIMKESYQRFLAKNPETSVKVEKRIIIGNTVIDEETASVSGKTYRQAAIYTISNGSITSMTFIHENEIIKDTESVVQNQLDAYNAKDIDGFMDTYTNDVKLYNYPHELISEGQEKMRGSYVSFFKNTPDLKCEIRNRMILGNKVIDEEFITMNGSNFSAVAIYEVENGKIAKVTFVQ